MSTTPAWPWAAQIAAYEAAQHRQGRRPRGVASYVKILRRLAAFAAGAPPTAALIEGYFTHRAGAGALRPATIASEHAVITSFARWGARRGITPPDLLSLVDRPRNARGAPLQAPRAQIQAVADWIQNPQLPRSTRVAAAGRARRLAALCLYAGLRLTEARMLTWHDCDLAAGAILVRDGKGGKSRRVPIAAPLRRVLEDVPPAERAGYVAGTATAPLSYGGAEHVFDRFLARRLGFDISAHMLRRAFATRLDEQRVSLRVIQELLGHSSLATTEKYLGVDSARLVAAVETLGGVWTC